MPKSGDLERWATQGVLLLNATLTVRSASPGSHQNKGWESFTDAAIKKISDEKENVVYLLWGAYAVHTRDVDSFEEMVAKAKRMVLRHHLAEAGDRVIVMAGVPFKTPGSTNVLHVVRIMGDELKGYS